MGGAQSFCRMTDLGSRGGRRLKRPGARGSVACAGVRGQGWLARSEGWTIGSR
jgi:hypothetical protein